MPMLPFFRKQPPQDPMIVAMTGVRLGQRLLIIAERDPSIPQELGAKVGLTGRILALAADESGASRLAARVLRHGVLIDTAAIALPLPTEDDGFDAAIVDERHARDERLSLAALLPELLRAVRPGGRVLVLRPAGRRWLEGLFGWQPEPPDVTPVVQALSAAGFHNPRPVGTRSGVAFVEAYVKGQQ
jgi:SAM-dependent methyltransferase